MYLLDNISGLIIFILFIITRAMMDRSKGMAKKPGTKAKRPAPVTAPKPTRTQPALPAKPRSIATAPPYKTQDLAYDAKPYMEGVGYGLRSEPETPGITSVLAPAPEQEQAVLIEAVITPDKQDYTLTNEDLRRAVIWSEILQKPRFRTRPGYTR